LPISGFIIKVRPTTVPDGLQWLHRRNWGTQQ